MVFLRSLPASLDIPSILAKMVIFFASILCIPITLAAQLPPGCKPISLSKDMPELSVTKPGILVLQNLTKEDLWITHPVEEAGASAGWNSKLQSGHFSALVLDQKHFALQCIESTPGHEQLISCQGALAVCLWKTVKIPRNETGTFWAAEDSKNLARLQAALLERNFIFPEEPE